MMKTLITTISKESFVKTVLFLQSIGYRFVSDVQETEEYIIELYDYIRKRWDTQPDDVMSIFLQGWSITVNTKSHYERYREVIDHETQSTIE